MKFTNALLTFLILSFLYTIADAQNVGIGEENPNSKLTVTDSVRNTISIKTLDNLKSTGIVFQNSTDSVSWNIYRKNDGSNVSDFIIAGGNPDPDVTNLIDRFRITHEGNTEVLGDAMIFGSTLLDGTLTTTNGNVIFNENGNSSDFRVEGNTQAHLLYLQGDSDRIGINNSSPSAKLDVVGSTELNGTVKTYGGNTIFNEGSGDHNFRIESNASEHMFFMDGGTNRIGINKSSPSATLDVVGTTELNGTTEINGSLYATGGNTVFNEVGGNYDLRIEGNTSQHLFFADGDQNRIGINTPFPSEVLDVFGNTKITGQTTMNGNTQIQGTLTQSGVMLKSGGNSLFNLGGEGVYHDFTIHTQQFSNLFFVDGSTNRIGINNPNPSAVFDVDGTTKFSGSFTQYDGNSVFNEGGGDYNFRIESDAKSNMFFVDGGENRIGIGRTNPTHTLDINGDLRVDGTSLHEGDLIHESGNVSFNNSNGNHSFSISTSNIDSLFFVDGSANKIGINTSTPSAMLEVVGSTTIDGLFLAYGPSIFNQNGLDKNLRVESMDNPNMLFVDAGENRIGIGTNSPSHTLNINGDLKVEGTSVHEGNLTQRSGNVKFNNLEESYDFSIATNNISSIFHVDGTLDRIGINTPSPSALLDIVGDIELNGNMQTYNGNIVFNEGGNSNDFRVESISNPDMFIVDGSTNRVGIGAAIPTATLAVKGTVRMDHEEITGPDNWPFEFRNSSITGFRGGLRITNGGYLEMTNKANLAAPNKARLDDMGNWTAVSDRRLKKDIVTANGLLAKTLQLNPVHYIFKTDVEEKNQLGLIAQEVQKVFPEFVTEDELLTLNYSGLSVAAIGAIQELNSQNEALRKRVEQLEKANLELAGQLSDIQDLKAQIKQDILNELNPSNTAESTVAERK